MNKSLPPLPSKRAKAPQDVHPLDGGAAALQAQRRRQCGQESEKPPFPSPAEAKTGEEGGRGEFSGDNDDTAAGDAGIAASAAASAACRVAWRAAVWLPSAAASAANDTTAAAALGGGGGLGVTPA